MATPEGILAAIDWLWKCGSVERTFGAEMNTIAQQWAKHLNDIPDESLMDFAESWANNEKKWPSVRNVRVYLAEVMHYTSHRKVQEPPTDKDRRKIYDMAEASCQVILEAAQEGWGYEKLMKSLQAVTGAPVSDNPIGPDPVTWIEGWCHGILPLMCMTGGYRPPQELQKALQAACHYRPNPEGDNKVSMKPIVKPMEPLVLPQGTPEEDAYADFIFGADAVIDTPAKPEIRDIF